MNIKKKVAIVDEDSSDVEEKPATKRGRGAATSKSSSSAKNKAIPYEPNDDDSEDNDDDDDDEKVETKGSKKNKDDNVEELPPAKKAKTESKLLNSIITDLLSINYDCDKLNKKGKKYNLKICSWNVSGVRAVIKKNGMNYFEKEDADIIAMQETKCDKDKLPNEIKLPGYKYYYLDSERSGYCGVALYCKNDREPIKVKFGLNNSDFDKDGRIITAEFDDFYVVNVYVPNSGRKLVNLPKRLKWNEEFKAHVKKLDKKKPVIICGDMNVAHEEIDLKNPKTNTKTAGFTREERDGMTDLLKQGFVDTFRQLYPDKTGAYTFWSYFANSRAKNIGWRLDYYIVSKSIKDHVCDNVMRSTVKGSDHCPIVLYINL